MIEADTEIHRETEMVAALGAELLSRYGGGALTAEINDAIRAQARQARGAAVRRPSGPRAGTTASSAGSTDRRRARTSARLAADAQPSRA